MNSQTFSVYAYCSITHNDWVTLKQVTISTHLYPSPPTKGTISPITNPQKMSTHPPLNQNILPLTPTHPQKRVHLHSPTQNAPSPNLLCHHPPIKNVHSCPTQNIPPLTPLPLKNVYRPQPNQKIPPLTPTYPKYISNHHCSPKKNVHSPSPNQNILPRTPTEPKYKCTHPHSPMKNVHLPRLTQNIPPPTLTNP